MKAKSMGPDLPERCRPFLAELEAKQQGLLAHPLYPALNDLPSLRIFMEFHVFAVWDFMSLLKSLQRTLTCVEVPWRPSPYPPRLVRFINEIVLGEESDEDGQGSYCGHFELYLRAMEEVGADRGPIHNYLREGDDRLLAPEIRDFIHFTLGLAKEGCLEEKAASFFFGREKLIPEMFPLFLAALGKEGDSSTAPFSSWVHYLKRHIEVDGESHGPLAAFCLGEICQDKEDRWMRAMEAANKSLDLRGRLWDGVLGKISPQ